jgi:tetratricopeptide (TPR) repeat protein
VDFVKQALSAVLISVCWLLSWQLSGYAEQKQPSGDDNIKVMVKEWASLPKGPEKKPGFVYVLGSPTHTRGSAHTEGAGVHVIPGWVLIDKKVIDGLPLATVVLKEWGGEDAVFLVVNSFPSSSPYFLWLEVPGLKKHPTAQVHRTPFNAGDYLFGYQGLHSEKAKVYRAAKGTDGEVNQIERATRFTLAYALAYSSGGPSFTGAYPLFDSEGLWSGFLSKKEPPSGLSRRMFETPNEEAWIHTLDLLGTNAPSHPARSMPGFPFRAFSAVLSGRSTAEYRDAISVFCARNPEDAWGWFAFGMAQVDSGRPGDGLAAYYRAVQLLPESPLMLWVLAGTLADSLAFEEAERYYERALKLDPSLNNWSDNAQRLGNVYHVLGQHDKEANLQFKLPRSPQETAPRWAFDYGKWLIEHNRYSEAEAYFSRAWNGAQEKDNPDAWIASMDLKELLDILHKLKRDDEIPKLFKAGFLEVADKSKRSALAEFWTRNGLAESKMDVYRQWLRTSSEPPNWLYELPPIVTNQLLTTDREVIKKGFKDANAIVEWLSYNLEHCEDAIAETKKAGIPQNGPDIDLQVKCLLKLDRREQAVELIEKAADPKDNSFIQWAGDLWREVGELKRARDAYLAAIENGGGQWNRWEGLAKTYEALGEKKKAKEAYQKALQLYKGEIRYFYGMSESMHLTKKLVEFGREEEILEFYRYGIQLGMRIGFSDEPGEATREQIIDLLCSIKGCDIAVSALKNGIAEYPGHAQSWLLLGKLYHRLGDVDEAAICLRRLQSLGSDYVSDLKEVIDKRVKHEGL